MVAEAGTGGTTAAPISRKIYEAIYGLDGNKRLLDANGDLPSALPVVRADGTIGAPGDPLAGGRGPPGDGRGRAPARVPSYGQLVSSS